MKLFFVGILLLAGVCRAAEARSEWEDGEFTECDEGYDLIDPPECPEMDPDHYVYFPFPYKCYQYIECTENVARCRRCPPETIWDLENLICVPGSVTNCTFITTTPRTTTTDDPIDFVCPGDFIGLIRHPYDCRLFYNCYLDKRPCVFECSDGLYFNPEYQWCDLPSNVPDCVGGSPPPPSTTPRLPAKDGRSLNYRNVERQSFAKAGRSLEEMLENRDAIIRDPKACETIPSSM